MPGNEVQNQGYEQYEQRHPCSIEPPSQGTLLTCVIKVQNTAIVQAYQVACSYITCNPLKMKKLRTYIKTEFRVFQKIQRYKGSNNVKSDVHDLYKDTPINFQDHISVLTMMLLTLAISGLSASSEPDEKSTCKNYIIIIIKYFIVYLQTDSPEMKIT